MNPAELRQRVVQVLEKIGGRGSRADIERVLGLDSVSSQALLRALRALEAEGLVRFEGATKARRYALSSGLQPSPSAVPLSPEALEAIALIDRPLHQREPVTYRRELLDANAEGFLSSGLRERLASLGRTPQANQPAGTYARHVLERLLLDLSWNSARLEGNTYSLLDTERLLKEGAPAAGKSSVETQMLLNHKAAIEYLVGEPPPATLDERSVKTLHALLMENLLGNAADEGRLRTSPVQIGGSVFVPLANPQLIDECFRQLVLTARQLEDPFEVAFLLLVQLPYLQPFIDGNKRTARLAANVPFVLHNLVPLSFVDVPRDLFQKAYLALYEQRRVEPLRDIFSWAYERSAARLGQVQASLGEPDPFRLEHRQTLREVVSALVKQMVAPAQRRGFLEGFAAAHLPSPVRPRFVAMAELEVESLHDGNFARYGLRPSEFNEWKQLR